VHPNTAQLAIGGGGAQKACVSKWLAANRKKTAT
jgi:hypothetical protein